VGKSKGERKRSIVKFEGLKESKVKTEEKRKRCEVKYSLDVKGLRFFNAFHFDNAF